MNQARNDLEGFRLWPGLLDRAAQEDLRDQVFARLRQGPVYVPRMPKSGQPMRVRMSNFGPLGWVTDKERGYRYQSEHPETGKPWPDMPARVLGLWRRARRLSRAAGGVPGQFVRERRAHGPACRQ